MRHLRVLPAAPPRAADDIDLDSIDVQTACQVPWEQMQGDNRVRFCGQCRKNVYNIEALPRAEAVRLIGAREGRLCVRFHRRPDGTVVTADCWTRLRAARGKGVLAFGAMLVVAGTAQIFAMLTGLAGLKRLGRQGEMSARALPAIQVDAPPQLPPSGHDLMMGDVAAPPLPAPPASGPTQGRHLMGKPSHHSLGRLPRR